MSRIGLTDTHCHLNHAQFDSDRTEVIERARLAGIERLLVIGCDLASSRFALELAGEFPEIQAAIGIHPESAAEWSADSADELIGAFERNRSEVAAWGEIGLDYFYADGPPRELQLQVFEEQLACANLCGLPVIIHCRDSYGDIMDILERLSFSRAVLHCFTGTADQAKRAIDAGLYIGVGGIATFKKSDQLRIAIASVPINRVLVETDSPYLAPQQWRGKRNEPAYVRAVAEMLAGLRGLTNDEVAAATTANADALFGRMDQQNFVDR